ncbi:hypothetical protein MRY87_11810 [bacterium]|nr:hypothetical protein [bacterium]
MTQKKEQRNIPKRIRKASEQYFTQQAEERRIRLKILKQRLSNGEYHPDVTSLATSLVKSLQTSQAKTSPQRR